MERGGRARRRRGAWTLVLAVLLIMAAAIYWLLFGLGRAETNFSQYPGFDAYFAANPPSSELPTPAERLLIERHRPRFFLPRDHAGLIGFYRDYVAASVLRDAGGTIISETVDRALLNNHKHDPTVVLEYRPQPGKRHPTVYGRLDRDEVDLGDGPRSFTFLTYHAVFETSGIAAGLAAWQEWLLWLIGDLDDWHQLDHYTAATLVLDETETPVALMLQQHNYQRTYLLGEYYDLPDDGRPEIDIAIRSNELYPHADGRRYHRSVRFLDQASLHYLLTGDGFKPFAADDVTEPAGEANYVLRFLPPDDAFYTFKGFLGERRVLPGRDSPPGADYNTLPSLKPLGVQFVLGYWRPGRAGDVERLDAAVETDDWVAAFNAMQAEILRTNLICAKRWGANCAFE